jgi:tRNA A-37 threonylcarbamoyl transferase component Bud32
VEDKAVDIRLLEEILKSLYPSNVKSLYESFLEGYSTGSARNQVSGILKNLDEIGYRRRYT